MIDLPQFQTARRPARLRLPEHTPAVLRLQDGDCTTGELQVVSLTGGLLALPTPLHRSVTTKLLFVTTAGPVLGTAEMLDPITHTQQPFRFVSMGGEDLRKLQTAIKTTLYPTSDEDEWIRKYRAAVAALPPPRRKWSGVTKGAIVALLAAVGGGLIGYLHWLK